MGQSGERWCYATEHAKEYHEPEDFEGREWDDLTEEEQIKIVYALFLEPVWYGE